MKDEDEARGEAFRLVNFVEEGKKNGLDGREETVQERTVVKEKTAEFLRDGEDTVAVSTVDKTKRHSSGAVNGIHVATCRTETGVASERDEFKVTAFTEVHSATERRIAAVKHPVDIFNYGRSRMGNI